MTLGSKKKHHDLWVASFEGTVGGKVNGEQLRRDEHRKTKRAGFQQREKIHCLSHFSDHFEIVLLVDLLSLCVGAISMSLRSNNRYAVDMVPF